MKVTYLFVELTSGARIYTSDLYYMEIIAKTVVDYTKEKTKPLFAKQPNLPKDYAILCSRIQVTPSSCQIIGMEIASDCQLLAIPTRLITKCYLVSRDVSPVIIPEYFLEP